MRSTLCLCVVALTASSPLHSSAQSETPSAASAPAAPPANFPASMWDGSARRVERAAVERALAALIKEPEKTWILENVEFRRASRGPVDVAAGVNAGVVTLYDPFFAQRTSPEGRAAYQKDILTFELGKAVWFGQVNPGAPEASTEARRRFEQIERRHQGVFDVLRYGTSGTSDLRELGDNDLQSRFAYAFRMVMLSLDLPVATPDPGLYPPARWQRLRAEWASAREEFLRYLTEVMPAPAPDTAGFLSRVAAAGANQPEVRAATDARNAGIRQPDTRAEDDARAERRAAAWEYLRATLQLACSDPDNLAQLRDQRRLYGVLLSREIVAQFSSRDRERMGACARGMVDEMLRSSGPANVRWIEKQGRRYFKDEQRRLRAERDAAIRAARAEAAQRAREQAHESYTRAEGRVSGGSSSSTGGGRTGEAYGQAVGIAGGATWIFDGR